METIQSESGQSVGVGLQDVGGHTPPLEAYRFLASATTKTATLMLFNSAGEIVATQTITATTTPQQATADALWSGDWDPEWVGAVVYGTPQATIYVLESPDGTPEVDATIGRALANGMCLGFVPQHYRNALMAIQKASPANLGAEGKLVLLQMEGGRVHARLPGSDTTNGLQKVAPASALGSGGLLTASGVGHNAPCALNGVLVTSATAAVWDVYDNASAASGTKVATLRVLAGDSKVLSIPGLAMGSGVYLNLVSGTGEAAAYVGPALV